MDFGRMLSVEEAGQKWWKFQALVESGLEVHRNYHADVYILLRRRGQTYEFTSTDPRVSTVPYTGLECWKNDWLQKMTTL